MSAAVTPSPLAVTRGQRIRRVWAELTRAQRAGEVPPSMRELARRCRLPSSSTAQTCVSALIALGVVEAVAQLRPSGPAPEGLCSLTCESSRDSMIRISEMRI